MSNRHQKIGIKQTIQRTWMDKTVQLMLAGMSEAEIRAELDAYLSVRKQSGGFGERGVSYKMALGLLASWFAPDDELVVFRNDLLEIAKETPTTDWLPLHWAMMCVAYPFWFNVAKQTGRLLNLQDVVTQPQIFNRLKEQYGDRETVSRNARYTVRSLVAWNVIQETDKRGRYCKVSPLQITDMRVAVLLIESGLHAIPEGKSSLSMLSNSPAYFPFQYPVISGDTLQHRNSRLKINRYSLDEVAVSL
jgi:hypothetical protein